MIGQSTLQQLFSKLIATGFIKEVFHSVIIRNAGNNIRKPSAPIGKAYKYVGIDDSKGFTCYCRALGPLEKVSEEKISDRQILYKTQTLHRLVFYNDSEPRNHDDISSLFVRTIIGNAETKFSRLYTNADDILRTEQPNGTFSLTPLSYYAAIDFYLILKLLEDNCQQEISCGSKNPFCL